MSSMIADSADRCQANPVARDLDDEDNDLVLIRRCFCEAIDESRVKQEAVAAALRVDGPYLSKMRTGEKPIAARHIAALPDNVEQLFAQKYAERFGLIVVAPLSGREAQRAFIAGLFGVLQERLPVRADQMAKATLGERKTRTA